MEYHYTTEEKHERTRAKLNVSVDFMNVAQRLFAIKCRGIPFALLRGRSQLKLFSRATTMYMSENEDLWFINCCRKIKINFVQFDCEQDTYSSSLLF